MKREEFLEKGLWHPDDQYERIIKECRELAERTKKDHPDISPEALPEKIFQVWQRQSIFEDHICLNSVILNSESEKISLTFAIDFRQKKRTIVIEL